MYLITRFQRSNGDVLWQPSLWTDLECRQEDISEYIWQATTPLRAEFERLGFTVCRFSKTTKSLNPNLHDSGGIFYLDPTRRYLGHLIYLRRYQPTTGKLHNKISITIFAAFDQGGFGCTNNQKTFDSVPQYEILRLDSYDVSFIYKQFQQHLAQRQKEPLEFRDLESLRRWWDAHQIELFEDRVRRGLYIQMTEQEVAAAKARLQSNAPKRAALPPKLNRRLVLLRRGLSAGIWVIFFVGLFYFHAHRNRLLATSSLVSDPNATEVGDDTIEYHGQQFKMRKHYATYEDYKDDPDNLDTNDLDRIERTVVSAKVPASFKNREEFIHEMIFDLRFPGYGMGGIGEATPTDDGSILEIESVEIPQRDKDRFIVVREVGGRLNVVDDFVFGSATNVLAHARLKQQKIYYYDQHGNVVREKQL